MDDANLPNDPEALKAMVESLRAQVSDAEVRASDAEARASDAAADAERKGKELEARDTRISQLENMVAYLRRTMFGRKSEKTFHDDNQLVLEGILPELDESDAAPKKPKRKRKRKAKRKVNRGRLPKHLPRVEETVEPESTACSCCGAEMERIGEDESEKLKVVPQIVIVIKYTYPKYRCRKCQQGRRRIIQAPAKPCLITNGLPVNETVAHVIVSKFADHLPLERQARILRRQGIDLDASTLGNWVKQAAFALRPVHEQLLASLKASGIGSADETTIPVHPGRRDAAAGQGPPLLHRGKTRQQYFWGFHRDERPWQGVNPPGTAFIHAPGRSGEYARQLLSGFAGILHVDGYAAYKNLPESPGTRIRLAHCMAHARRKLFEIWNTGHDPIAGRGLELIARLYAVEKEIRGRKPDERLAARRKASQPIVGELEKWIAESQPCVPAKSPIGKALAYFAHHWEGLTLFLGDGRIEIDNNSLERSIRPVALTRKNSLFAGNESAARDWAVLASLIETCRLNDVNPQEYLTWTLDAICADHKQSRIDELLPWSYAGLNRQDFDQAA